MEFRLIYDGPLKAAAGVDDKHHLRKAFHEQFKALWEQVPLSNNQDLFEDDNLITKVNVSTDRLLRQNAGQNDVVMIIHVTTKAVRAIWGNMGLG